jgi:acetyl-CoA acetyltransferase family protein
MKGLVDPSCDLSMGQTAEKVAGEHGVTREDQDAFALESNRRAVAARDKLREEICELYVPPRYEVMLENDDGPRPDSSLEKLARLRPVFEKRDGTVTAGNSSQITDGAVCLVLMDEDLARAEGRKSLGRIRAHATVGLDPTRMGLGPAHALVKLMDQEGVTLSDIELMEINEAFAAQVIAVQRALASDTFCQEHFDRKAVGEIPSDRLNVNGGAVALGHPVGASGARIIHTLLLEMGRRDLGLGAASLCVGGGQGQAVLVER